MAETLSGYVGGDAGWLRIAAEMLEDNQGIRIPTLEFPSKTVRRLIEMRRSN